MTAEEFCKVAESTGLKPGKLAELRKKPEGTLKNIISQIKSHAEAAKSAPDIINHLDAIIGACGMLEQELERSADVQETPRTILEFTRDYHLAKANEIKLETLPAEKLVAAYYDRDRLKYTAAVLNELLKRITK